MNKVQFVSALRCHLKEEEAKKKEVKLDTADENLVTFREHMETNKHSHIEELFPPTVKGSDRTFSK
jgi:hypothetical protein